MRLPRLRFTVRRMIFAVAVVALLLWCSVMTPQARRYRQRLSECVAGEARFLRDVNYVEAQIVRFESEGNLELSLRHRQLLKNLRVYVEWSTGLRRKYEHALWCPWLSVEADPPPPHLPL